MKNYVVTVGAIKGGAGKTTTALALAQAAAHEGKQVLLIDLDPQCNASTISGTPANPLGSLAMLQGRTDVSVSRAPQGYDLIPACPDLAAETSKQDSAKRLKSMIDRITRHYDLIVIDTAPAVTEGLFNALMAADKVVIPMEADGSNLQGMYDMIDLVDRIKKANKNIKIAGVVATRYDGRAKVNQAYLQAIETATKSHDIPFLGIVRNGVAIKETHFLRRNLYDYAPRSNPAQDYLTVYKKIMKKG